MYILCAVIFILLIFLYNTLMMVSESIATCHWVIFTKTDFTDVRLLVYHIIKISVC
jgi:hypothetical protein